MFVTPRSLRAYNAPVSSPSSIDPKPEYVSTNLICPFFTSISLLEWFKLGWYSAPSLTKFWVLCVLGDGLTVFFAFFLGYLFEFIEDPEKEAMWGFLGPAVYHGQHCPTGAPPYS